MSQPLSEQSEWRNPNLYDRFQEGHGGRYRKPVSKEDRRTLVDDLQYVVATLIASAIDAGSEADAVMEDEELTAALDRLVEEWVETYD